MFMTTGRCVVHSLRRHAAALPCPVRFFSLARCPLARCLQTAQSPTECIVSVTHTTSIMYTGERHSRGSLPQPGMTRRTGCAPGCEGLTMQFCCRYRQTRPSPPGEDTRQSAGPAEVWICILQAVGGDRWGPRKPLSWAQVQYLSSVRRGARSKSTRTGAGSRRASHGSRRG